jgi:hypothetical protein
VRNLNSPMHGKGAWDQRMSRWEGGQLIRSELGLKK